mmetsp:Transcript_36768/g.44347  ORF Transcript_36768/g.44347 Transcript_36768/m.44347 type:complete len:387 (+) Transcript_36768:76-1236(+)
MPKSSDSLWERRYSQVQDYINEFGHSRVPRYYTKNTALGKWVSSQRAYYKLFQENEKTVITKERIQLLNKINFEWDPIDNLWNNRYDELKSYLNDNSVMALYAREEQNPKLKIWIGTQRKHYKLFQKDEKSHMTKQRINLLNNIGFAWDGRINASANDTPVSLKSLWETRFQELKAYADEFGHANVPYRYAKNLPLGNWVKNQRLKFKKFLQNGESARSLTKEQVARLQNVNFAWNINDVRWYSSYEELKIYFNKEGHSRLPTKYHNKQLQSWVKDQRKHYEKHTISKERIKSLNEIAFEWVPGVDVWEDGYGLLKAFVSEFGHARIPMLKDDSPYFKLVDWSIFLREQCVKLRAGDKTFLTEKRISILYKIGFEWDTKPTPTKAV